MIKIPNSLLLTYQAEYEQNQELTIEDLCTKYDVDTKQLKGYTKWQKKIPNTNKLPELVEPTIVIDTTETLLKDIDTFKTLAMAHALKFMKDDAQFAEVKEFKDMVSIVGTIESSLKDTKPENVINIAIQSIVKGFQDDC